MADTHEANSEQNPSSSATAAVGSEQQSSSVTSQPAASIREPYFRDPTSKDGDRNSNNGGEATTSRADNNIPGLPPAVWASFFRGMAESFRNNEAGTSSSRLPLKKMKPSDVYIPSFDPDDCEFTAALWCDEVDHHRLQNEWTDYETRNAAFTHLRGRARKWASKSYPLCKTWGEAKERITRQFATTKRFHDLFRDMVQYTSDQAAKYVDYSTNKLAMIDRLETGWCEANKIEVVISGLGRTGVLIACYLVWSLRVRANDAIRLLRRRRPRSVQTSGQILCVQQFEHYLLPQTVVFSSKEPLMLTKDKQTAEFTLRQFLHRQRATLHGLDERAFRELPKIVYVICERLLRLSGCATCAGLDLRVRSRPFYRRFLAWRLKKAKRVEPVSPESCDVQGDEAECVPTLPMVEWRDPVEEDIEWNLESVSRITGAPTRPSGGVSALQVYEAFVVDHHSLPEEQQKRLKQLRNDINLRVDALDLIDEEEDPAVLSGLLFEWLEGLKTPVLDRQDLALIVSRGQDATVCAQQMDTEDIMLLEYLLRFVLRLRPLAALKRVDLLRRLLAALTHQTVSVSGRCLPTHRDFARLRDGTCNQVINFMLRMIVELQKDMIKPGKDDNDVVLPKRLRIKAWK